MEITIARTFQRELQKKISELMKEYEKTTSLSVAEIKIVRQSSFDKLGNEVDFNYATEVISYL